MPTANELYQDALLRRALEVDALEAATIRRVVTLLNNTEDDVADIIRRRLERIGDPQSHIVTDRFRQTLDEIDAIRSRAWLEGREVMRSDLFDASAGQAGATADDIVRSVGIDMAVTIPSATLLRSIVTTQPFRGRVLNEWARGLESDDLRRIHDQIKIGLVEGEGIDAIVRRIVGTRANQFKDGVLEISRRNAQAVVRTANTHVSNAAREAVWEANADIVLGLRWTATLDGRTTPICMSRDGKVTELPGAEEELPASMERLIPAAARPPAHFSCRSIMVAILSPDGVVGNRPTVTDTRTRRQREVDFRKNAREKAGAEEWKRLDRKGRDALIREERSRWAAERVGSVPAETTYQQFLSRQSAAFQNDVLGSTRGRLFRSGGLGVDDLVTRQGRRIPLAELRRKHPDAFKKAGLDVAPPPPVRRTPPRPAPTPEPPPPAPVAATPEAAAAARRAAYKEEIRDVLGSEEHWAVRDKRLDAERKKIGGRLDRRKAKATTPEERDLAFTKWREEIDVIRAERKKSDGIKRAQQEKFLGALGRFLGDEDRADVVFRPASMTRPDIKRSRDLYAQLRPIFSSNIFRDKNITTSGNILPSFAILPRRARAYFSTVARNRGKTLINAVRVPLDEVNDLGLFAHELVHWIDNVVPEWREKVTLFLNRRRGDDSPRPLARIFPRHGYRRDEIAVEDDFIHAYMGKIYRSGDNEIGSMGIQMLLDDPVRLLEEDSEMFELMLDLLEGDFT